MDLYGTTASLPPPVVRHVAARLGGLWPTGSSPLSLSAGVWLLRVLSWSLRDDLELTLAPVVVADVAQAIVFGDRNTVVQRLMDVVRDLAESDPKRSAELRSALDWLKSRPSAGPWAAFLGSVYVRDPDTRDEIAELDGVVACFQPDGVQWTVLERKDGKTGIGQVQLSRFQGLLHAPGNPPAACDAATWALSFHWPGPPQPRSE